ncbi:hypothetical protein GWI33_020850 [Rhynchophorus ferrugineus]|uniref:Uncharacterized protein n=1 Tax=Rhynchophorus ferrugineus TaxID=354439 RepID=A0A834M305_RHYFE|nr:hypothetical protein GWI33_020850 [Rhynchophorus ferrugineus]
MEEDKQMEFVRELFTDEPVELTKKQVERVEYLTSRKSVMARKLAFAQVEEVRSYANIQVIVISKLHQIFQIIMESQKVIFLIFLFVIFFTIGNAAQDILIDLKITRNEGGKRAFIFKYNFQPRLRNLDKSMQKLFEKNIVDLANTVHKLFMSVVGLKEN